MESVGRLRPPEPGGMAPERYDHVLGKRPARAIRRCEPIDWDAITKGRAGT